MATTHGSQEGGTYSRSVATIYVFNLIFGSGALLLPRAFGQVGYLLGTIFFLILSFLSFITCTYVVEVMSLACAVSKTLKEGTPKDNDNTINEKIALIPTKDGKSSIKKIDSANDSNNNDDVNTLNISNRTYQHNEIFEITEKYELSEMARLFFNKPLLIFFFLSTIIYLFGDLLIYITVVGNSLRKLTCDAGGKSTPGTRFCNSIGEINVFRIYITLFVTTLGSLIFFNVTKTKLVQFGTIGLRWLAFITMLVLAIRIIVIDTDVKPSKATFTGLPVFIGTGLYSFMCQHSLPSILYPIKSKNKSYLFIFVVSISCVLALYLLVTFTAVFAFPADDIEKVYTMNFMTFDDGLFLEILGYFLQCFPVIALSSSYPIVGITLRENLKALIFKDVTVKTRLDFFLKRILIPTCVIYLPYIMTLFLSNYLDTVAGVVGSYAGNLVQYVIPSLLLIYGSRKAAQVVGKDAVRNNFHRSLFGHTAFIVLMLAWSFASMAVVTYYNVITLTKH